MGTSVPIEFKQVGILVIDDDPQSADTIRQILDSESWRVRIVVDAQLLLAELKTGEWSLVIANVALTGINGPAFSTLRELAQVPARDGGRVRTLFLIPEMTGSNYIRALEAARLPYVLRPYHLHDFLERVSDLLVEIKAIRAPLRQVRQEFGDLRKKKRQAARATSMFAPRDTFFYTEEELAEYERQEAESENSKSNKPNTDLGNPHRGMKQ
jgi:DNA-binding response OmpR family regulator